MVIVPALLVEPRQRLRDVARIGAVALDGGSIDLGAMDDVGWLGAAFDRGLEFQPRGLLWIRMRTPRRIGVPEDFKFTIGAILAPVRGIHARASGASDRSMQIDRMILVLTGSGEARFTLSDAVLHPFRWRNGEGRFTLSGRKR